MFGLFQSPSYNQAPLSKDQVDERYRYWRLHIMLGMYLGYAGLLHS